MSDRMFDVFCFTVIVLLLGVAAYLWFSDGKLPTVGKETHEKISLEVPSNNRR